MHFLLNDVVLNLEGDALSPMAVGRRFAAVGFGAVQALGQELFAEEPAVQHTHPERALRLAALICSKQPGVNAALFVAAAKGCKPAQVGVRLASVDIAVLASLHRAHERGLLDAGFADREVWGRLAA